MTWIITLLNKNGTSTQTKIEGTYSDLLEQAPMLQREAGAITWSARAGKEHGKR